MKLIDVKVDESEYANISLSKLMGKKVVDIHGSFSKEFGDISFKLTKVVFEGYGDNSAKLPTKLMDALYDEENNG